MKRILFIIFSLGLISQLSAQYKQDFEVTYFSGNLPSAKVEAMGMGDAAIGGSVASLFFNPAGLGGIEKQEILLSTSAPFYLEKNANYYTAAFARRIIPRIVAAFSANTFSLGNSGWLFDSDYPVTKGVSSNYALSVAGTPLKGLYIGVNFNLYRLKYFDELKAGINLYFDGGILYKLALPELGKFEHYTQFGVSVSNFTNSKITFDLPDGGTRTNEFPVLGRFAVAYFMGTDVHVPFAGTGPLDFTLTIEYQNTFNNDYLNTFIVGFETVFWDVLAMRLGYFTQSLNDYGVATNRDHLTDFTYGFGAIVPINKLTDDKVPLSLHFDFVSLKQPPYNQSAGNAKVSYAQIPNMRTFTLRVVWALSNLLPAQPK
jgi:hypothetical protein